MRSNVIKSLILGYKIFLKKGENASKLHLFGYKLQMRHLGSLGENG